VEIEAMEPFQQSLGILRRQKNPMFSLVANAEKAVPFA